jgi:4-hydroxybenzoate polyprenyltransferase
MDLDKLKSVWQKESSAEQKQDEELRSLLQKPSNSPVAKMKRNLFMELILVVITYSLMILYYFIAFSGKMWEVSLFMLVLALVFIIYYFRKNKLLNDMQCLSCHVKSNLERQVKILEKYIKFYLITGTIVVPLAFFFFAIIIYYKFPATAKRSLFFTSPENPLWRALLVWVIVTTALTIVIYYLNKWYVQKLYGKHILKLKEMLREMEDEKD